MPDPNEVRLQRIETLLVRLAAQAGVLDVPPIKTCLFYWNGRQYLRTSDNQSVGEILRENETLPWQGRINGGYWFILPGATEEQARRFVELNVTAVESPC